MTLVFSGDFNSQPHQSVHHLTCSVLQEGAGAVTLVFSGDFNSQPHQSVHHLMTTGKLTVQDFNDCEYRAEPSKIKVF